MPYDVVNIEIEELRCEVARLRQALSDIADPFAAWQRNLKQGEQLNSVMCVVLANEPETYKRRAREALSA